MPHSAAGAPAGSMSIACLGAELALEQAHALSAAQVDGGNQQHGSPAPGSWPAHGRRRYPSARDETARRGNCRWRTTARERLAVVGDCQRRLGDRRRIAVHEVHVVTSPRCRQQRIRAQRPQLVPAHVRHGAIRRAGQALHVAADDAQARRYLPSAEFARLEQQLHSEADAQHRLLQLRNARRSDRSSRSRDMASGAEPTPGSRHVRCAADGPDRC